jgi:hypothetical protein
MMKDSEPTITSGEVLQKRRDILSQLDEAWRPTPNVTTLDLTMDEIRAEPEIFQSRPGQLIDEKQVEELVAQMDATDGYLPPLQGVLVDGEFWLTSGFHRYTAAKRRQGFTPETTLRCDVLNVRPTAALCAGSAENSRPHLKLTAKERTQVAWELLVLRESDDGIDLKDKDICGAASVSKRTIANLKADILKKLKANGWPSDTGYPESKAVAAKIAKQGWTPDEADTNLRDFNTQEKRMYGIEQSVVRTGLHKLPPEDYSLAALALVRTLPPGLLQELDEVMRREEPTSQTLENAPSESGSRCKTLENAPSETSLSFIKGKDELEADTEFSPRCKTLENAPEDDSPLEHWNPIQGDLSVPKDVGAGTGADLADRCRVIGDPLGLPPECYRNAEDDTGRFSQTSSPSKLAEFVRGVVEDMLKGRHGKPGFSDRLQKTRDELQAMHESGKDVPEWFEVYDIPHTFLYQLVPDLREAA